MRYAGAHDYEICHSVLKRDREGIESELTPLTNKGKGLEEHACISAEDENAENWYAGNKHSMKSEFDRSSCNSTYTNRECDPDKKRTRFRYEAPSKNNGEEVAEDDNYYEEGPEPVAVADSDFYDFDRHRSEECFAVDQMWAIFDDLDDETAWKRSGLPAACGVFKHEKTHIIEGVSTFSHKIVWQKGARNTYKIYPRKGETWALYKNWNVKWSSDPDNHREYEYEFVVVLSDYTKSGILVARLVKLKGYVCLFKPVKNNGMPSFQIPVNEMLRFSHRVPSFRTNGREHKTVPEGYFELDPASLPNNLEEVSDFTDGKAETVDVLENLSMPKKRKILSSDCVTAVAKSITEQIPSSSSSTFDPCELPESEFCLFETDKTQHKFQVGQLWAVYCELDGLPKHYARIKKVESVPQFKVNIQWLEICTPRPNGCCLQWLDNKIPTCCGIFSSGDDMEFHDTLSSSHLVKGTVAGMENKVAIFPRNGEVWAIYRNFSSEWSFSDLQACKYDIGQVVQVSDIYKVLVLEKVSDYKTVFKAQTKAGRQSLLEISSCELLRFSHQIPAIQLTDKKEGTLRGCWELDPKAVPVRLFSSISSSFSKEASFADQAGAKEMGSDGVGTNFNIVAERSTQGPFHLDSCEIPKAQCSKFGKPEMRINSENKSTMVGRRKPIGRSSSTRSADVYEEMRTAESSGRPQHKRKATTVSVGKKSCAGPTFRRLADIYEENAAANTKKVIPDGVHAIPVSLDKEIPSSPSPLKIFEKPETEFYNFDNERSREKFKTGQTWALYCKLDELPKNYALIESVESYPLFKLAVKWLKSCNPPRAIIPWIDKGMPVCCGTFKVASGDGVVFNDSIYFSHQVSGVAAGNDLQTIYPRVGEVWALYTKFRSDLKCSDLKSCEYYIVEVLEVFDASWIIVSLLQSVTGFKMLFSAKEKEGFDSIAAAVPWTELYRFSHQVPAFRLTEARYGKLCGCWELDPKSVPVCLHSTNER
ncbi:hypothetical protein C5167_012586 [Papaver somniferum]|uniref:DUF3444 domain-containing protein n=1 Tax=Papaver somniferum TaxID=3469 RepID=A0A4Y7IYN1_PAPSO|nr:hypothetical protein C5167_012586 [Papaver somniferum]